jgi:hypothetical protein
MTDGQAPVVFVSYGNVLFIYKPGYVWGTVTPALAVHAIELVSFSKIIFESQIRLKLRKNDIAGAQFAPWHNIVGPNSLAVCLSAELTFIWRTLIVHVSEGHFAKTGEAEHAIRPKIDGLTGGRCSQ